MKIILTVLFVTIGLLVGSPSYAAKGDDNGKPFQELEQRLEEAIAAAVAAEEQARMAADAAEAAVRDAADARLEAAIALEVVERAEADAMLQAEIDTHAALLLDLDDRVSVLEGLHLTRSVTWEETAGFDVVDLRGPIAGLNYQPGEWVFIVSRNAQTGREFGNCTNDPYVADWLAAVSAGTDFYRSVSGAGSYLVVNGYWSNSPTFNLYTRNTPSYQVMEISRYPWLHQLVDRRGSYPLAEIYSYYYYGGYYLGNTLTINVGSDSLGTCGYQP